jgi:hypothetical protein
LKSALNNAHNNWEDKGLKLAYSIESKICEQTVWRRTHRPEEYLADVISYIAGEIGVNRHLLMPLAPVARTILRRWDDAAHEFTEYTFFEDGKRIMRTFFLIHNYSNSVVYAMIEKVLKLIGVGKSGQMRSKNSDTDFAWVLLGGVLNDYADRAGVSQASTKALLDFRLRNSDYNTTTTWYPDSVEIANLVSGRVETLAMPVKDINRIVDWGLEYHQSKCHRHYVRVEPDTDPWQDFSPLKERYLQVTEAVSDR